MTVAAIEAPEDAPKRSRKGLIFMALIALVLAGAGFAASYLGLVQRIVGGGESAAGNLVDGHDAPAFVPIDTITIVLPGSPSRQFRMSAQIEVAPGQAAAVQAMLPRAQNVLQGFLRALDPDELADRAAWFDLRLKMLYRLRMVLGEAQVRDLLITDFIVN